MASRINEYTEEDLMKARRFVFAIVAIACLGTLASVSVARFQQAEEARVEWPAEFPRSGASIRDLFP
jgi:hypothetical protein